MKKSSASSFRIMLRTNTLARTSFLPDGVRHHGISVTMQLKFDWCCRSSLFECVCRANHMYSLLKLWRRRELVVWPSPPESGRELIQEKVADRKQSNSSPLVRRVHCTEHFRIVENARYLGMTSIVNDECNCTLAYAFSNLHANQRSKIFIHASWLESYVF